MPRFVQSSVVSSRPSTRRRSGTGSIPHCGVSCMRSLPSLVRTRSGSTGVISAPPLQRTPASLAYRPDDHGTRPSRVVTGCLGNAYAVGCRSVARTYTAGEAARALGISLDTLRRWDRQGRIRVQRDAANRRVVPAREVNRLRGDDRRTLSARNRLEGVVREVKIDGLLAEVELDVTKGGRLVAVITRESAENLGLTPGMSPPPV